MVTYNAWDDALEGTPKISSALDDIATLDATVTHVDIDESLATADLDSYNVIFLHAPTSDYTAGEKAALRGWYEGGKAKRRVVAIGEADVGVYAAMNDKLNAMLAELQNSSTRYYFLTSDALDSGEHYSTWDSTNHYLQDGVLSGCKYAYTTLASGFGSSNSENVMPRIDDYYIGNCLVKCMDRADFSDNYTGGSVVVYGDSSMIIDDPPGYDPWIDWDTDIEYNVKLLWNVCTVFRTLGEYVGTH